MKNISRIGDIGTGTCLAGHSDVPRGQPKSMTTKMITGSGNVFVNFRPVVRVGDVGETDCGHLTKAITGSSTVFVNFKPIHRISDTGEVRDNGATYKDITGSGNVFSG